MSENENVGGKGLSLVAFPLYKQLPTSFFTHWLEMDKGRMAGTITIDGVYITTAMTKIVEMAMDFDAEWEWLVVMEHDMIVPPDALNRISTYGPDKDIVGALYFQHNPPYLPCAFGPKANNPEEFCPLGTDIVKQIVDTPALYEVSAVGMGFTAINRRVFEGWDREVPMWVKEAEMSHDVWFCHQAVRQGFRVFVDTTLNCLHITEGMIGYSHNQMHEEMYEELVSHHDPDQRWAFKEGETQDTEADPKTYSITEVLRKSKESRERVAK